LNCELKKNYPHSPHPYFDRKTNY